MSKVAARISTAHSYHSTACQHGIHEQCRRTCKFCDQKCGCDCHAAPTEIIIVSPVGNCDGGKLISDGPICETCDGEGRTGHHPPRKCPDCDGRGRRGVPLDPPCPGCRACQ